MRSKRRTRWREWWAGWRWSWVTTGAVVLIVGLGLGYLHTREPAWAETACRGLYAQARTATDSAAVDNEFVWRRISGKWQCGLLRRTGAIDRESR